MSAVSGARSSRLAIPLGVGALAGLGMLAVASAPVRLRPGEGAWRRLVGVATASGEIPHGAVVVLPGLERSRHARVLIEAAATTGGAASLGIGIDGGPLQWVRSPPRGATVVPLPPAATPGLRLDLRPAEGAPAPRLLSLAVDPVPPRARPALLGFLLVAGTTATLFSRWSRPLAASLGLAFAGLLSLAYSPALLFLTLPATGSVLRALLPLGLLGAALALGHRREAEERRALSQGALLLSALVFGAWGRAYFLPSSGSWDTEYWKAWMMRAASNGLSRVYGDPGAVPAGHLLAQLKGEEELWKVDFAGRAFVVDYPPLAMAVWRWSWWGVNHWARGMSGAEAQNAAVKLPAVLGDVAAVAVLLWALRDRPRRGMALAALYWALPVSWLSSAVLGFLDGAVAPAAAAALVAAGRGRPGWSGAWLAIACLLKPTAIIVAPAAAVALLAGGSSVRRAAGGGLAVVMVTLLPFLLEGTLVTAVVHVYRILFQGTLSGGFPNPWWVLGHALTAGDSGGLGPVRYAQVDLVPFPIRVVGSGLFAVAAFYIAWRQRRAPGAAAASLAGAALFLAYGMLAVGVHENHPHPLFLMLCATGLASRRLRLIGVGTAAVYVLNMLALSGLGRFHGPRYTLVQAMARPLEGWRMAAGFDVTLALAVAACALFAALMAFLGREMDRVAMVEGGGFGGG